MPVSNTGMCFQVLHALGSQSIEIWFSKVAQNFTAVCLLNKAHLWSSGCLALLSPVWFFVCVLFLLPSLGP